jgi:hypothetical protein
VQALLQNGHQIAFHDLYPESFDSMLCLEEIAKDASLGDTIRIPARSWQMQKAKCSM